MPSLINTPVYILNNVDIHSLGKFKKTYFLLLGVFYSYIEKIFKNNSYCFFINILPFSMTKSYFKDSFYYLTDSYGEFYFTNKRFTRMVSGIEAFSEHLARAYLLHNVEFHENDTVIDCGSNVGELIPYFYKKYPNLNYIAFEPDREIYKALEKNFLFQNGSIFQFGLSDKDQKMNLYVDSTSADTSLEETDSNEVYEIDVKALDSFDFDEVKLIKIDGEGHEMKILQGARKTLPKTKFVSVDHSAEKGLNKSKTTPEVFTILFEEGFVPIFTSEYRDITLFKNKKL